MLLWILNLKKWKVLLLLVHVSMVREDDLLLPVLCRTSLHQSMVAHVLNCRHAKQIYFTRHSRIGVVGIILYKIKKMNIEMELAKCDISNSGIEDICGWRVDNLLRERVPQTGGVREEWTLHHGSPGGIVRYVMMHEVEMKYMAYSIVHVEVWLSIRYLTWQNLVICRWFWLTGNLFLRQLVSL